MDSEALRKIINTWRESLNYPCTYVEKIAGVGQGTVSKFLAGETKSPSLRVLAAIYRVIKDDIAADIRWDYLELSGIAEVVSNIGLSTGIPREPPFFIRQRGNKEVVYILSTALDFGETKQDWVSAIKYLRSMCEELKADVNMYSIGLCWIVSYSLNIGDYESIQYELDELRRISDRLDRYRRYEVKLNEGRVYFKLRGQNTHLAEECYEQALTLAQEIGLSALFREPLHYLARIKSYEATISKSTGNKPNTLSLFAEAMHLHEKAQEHLGEDSTDFHRAVTIFRKSQTAFEMGDSKKANTLRDEARILFKRIDYTLLVDIEDAFIKILTDEPNHADLQMANDCLIAAYKRRYVPIVVRSLHAIALYMFDKGKLEEAFGNIMLALYVEPISLDCREDPLWETAECIAEEVLQKETSLRKFFRKLDTAVRAATMSEYFDLVVYSNSQVRIESISEVLGELVTSEK
jgi:tetratricopeptide (TPR) repeat protein